ncbi:MAG TPA: threonine synthase, partial [Candidatus Krumholzibacterium sp.]|nr:threonine synthase [Candidatus Krumholzibacterium sp.]
GVGSLYIKDESCNPTGSFKARGMAAAVSRVLDLGVRSVQIPSAGNAGLALSAYSAYAGLDARVYIPLCTPEGVAEECRAYGAQVVVAGDILPEAAGRMSEDSRDREGIITLSTFREPCRVEGKKTIAFEIEADLQGPPPRWILFPTGGGTGIVAIWKAYLEMEELGWLRGPRPGMIVVQSTGCAPIVKAFEEGAATVAPCRDPDTIAAGIRVPGSRADRLILRALRETGGTAVAVDDSAIMEAAGEMASLAGIFPAPEGAAAFAGLKTLVSNGSIDPADSVVVVNTAGWSRYRFMLEGFSG